MAHAIHTAPNPAEWDTFIHAQPDAHLLQLHAWGTLKAAFGWDVQRVALVDGTQIIAAAQLLFRPLPFKLGKLAYLPMGPYAPPEHQAALWDAIHRTAKQHGARFLKWEPGLFPSGNPPDPFKQGFKPSPQTVQPPRTLLIDIRANEDAILARMNQGTRRKIRTGEKKDVHFYRGTADDVATFTTLMQTTGDRNEFGVHEPEYYRMAFDLFAPSDTAALFLAEHEGDPLAGVMAFAVGKMGYYLYGASSNIKRNLMASYGVQWQALLWAKSRGCAYYDLWGIPDADESTLEAEFQEREDGLWGVYGFKRGWGGQVIRSSGAWDFVYQPVIYAAYRAALKVRG